jgi:hypothetical protein
VLSVRLIEADTRQSYRYVTLSLCCASSEPLKTDASNYIEYRKEIPWSSLSEVYHDTLTLAAALSTSYVWIESLCIIQNHANDWQKEASRMGVVYSNAFIVFVAMGPSLALEKDPDEKVVIDAYANRQK